MAVMDTTLLPRRLLDRNHDFARIGSVVWAAMAGNFGPLPVPRVRLQQLCRLRAAIENAEEVLMQLMIFTGAGASAADGAPIQAALFKAFACELRANDNRKLYHSAWSSDEALPPYFREFFGIDIFRDDLDEVDFPTFEEALGVLELARGRDDSFGNRSYQLGHRPQTTLLSNRFDSFSSRLLPRLSPLHNAPQKVSMTFCAPIF